MTTKNNKYDTLKLKIAESVKSAIEIPEYRLEDLIEDGVKVGFKLIRGEGQVLNEISWPASFNKDGDTISITYARWSSRTEHPDEYTTWFPSIPNPTSESPYLWMKIQKNDGDPQYVCLTGEKGQPGTDGKNGANTAIDYDGVDFIFCRTNEKIQSNVISQLKTAINNYIATKTDHFPATDPIEFEINGNTYYITGDALGVEENNKYEYIGIRVKDSEGIFKIKTFTTWSIWGKQGNDGASIEYIFAACKNDDFSSWPSHCNPRSWSDFDDFKNPDYTGPYNLDTTVIRGGQWSDNPVNGDITYPYVLCCKRKYINEENPGVFSNPTIWSQWIDVEKANNNVQVIQDRRVISYIEGDTPDRTITLTALYGANVAHITQVTKGIPETNVSIISASNNSIKFDVELSETSTTHLYKVYIAYTDYKGEEHITSRTISIDEVCIPSTGQGEPGDNYKLIIEPNIIQFDNYGDRITNSINYKIIKNGYEISYTGNTSPNWKLTFTPHTNVDGQSIEVDKNNYTTYSSYSIPNGINSNGHYIKVQLKIDNNLWDQINIPAVKNGQSIVSKYLVRQCGEWNSETTYSGMDDEVSSDNIHYVDVVYVKVNLENSEQGRQYYLCKQECTNENPTNDDGTYWEEAYQEDFAYIKALISDTISAQSVQAKELLILDENDHIEAGMTSGNRINDSGDLKDVRIWAGASTDNIAVLDEFGNITEATHVDLTNAPFRVYNDGRVVANSISLALNTLKSNSDITLPEFHKGSILYFAITTNNISYNLTSIGNASLYIWDGSNFSEKNKVQLKEKGVYFVCGTVIDNKNVWLLTHTVYNVIGDGDITEWVEVKASVGGAAYQEDTGLAVSRSETITAKGALHFTLGSAGSTTTIVSTSGNTTANPSWTQQNEYRMEISEFPFWYKATIDSEPVEYSYGVTVSGYSVTGSEITFGTLNTPITDDVFSSEGYLNCTVGLDGPDENGWYQIGSTIPQDNNKKLSRNLPVRLYRKYTHAAATVTPAPAQTFPNGTIVDQNGKVCGYVNGNNITNTTSADITTQFQGRALYISKDSTTTLTNAEAAYYAYEDSINNGGELTPNNP